MFISGYRVPDVGFRMSTSGCRVPDIRFPNSSPGFQPLFTPESRSQTLNTDQVETAIKEMMKLRIDRSNSITLSYFPSDLPPCIEYPERECSRMFERERERHNISLFLVLSFSLSLSLSLNLSLSLFLCVCTRTKSRAPSVCPAGPGTGTKTGYGHPAVGNTVGSYALPGFSGPSSLPGSGC